MSNRDRWIRIALFVAVTYVWSGFFMGMAIADGDITLLTAFGGMWSPFVGLLVTRLVFPDGRRRGSLAGLGWKWSRTKYQVGSFFLPGLYVGVAHLAVWVFGLAGFWDAPLSEVAVLVLKRMAMGVTVGSVLAFGEEVGWQGFLVPQLYKMMSFTKTSLARGLIWSLWHYPLIIGGVYGPSSTPLWYRMLFFTITLTAVSFAFTWLRVRSGSLWTGVFLHAGHNIFIQSVYPRLTTHSDVLPYLTDEFGVLCAAAAVLTALVFWMKRDVLPPAVQLPTPQDSA